MKDEQFNDADILLRLDRLTSLLIAYFGGDRREPWQRDSDSAGRVVAGNWRRRDETTAHSTLGESHALEAFLKRNPSAVELHEFFDKQYREHNRVTQQAVDGARSDDSFAAAMNAAGRAMRDGRDCRSNLRKNARDASESWEQAMNRRGRELREGR